MTSENLNFPLDASQYELQYIIGHGATSDVYVAKCLANNKTLSIKLINLEAYPLEIEFLRQEVAFWSSTQLPQVVRYYGSFVSGPMLYILMEYMAGGSVSDIIRYSFPKGFKDEKIIATILFAILKALSYIHSHDELHRDVKPGNALVGEDGQVKIADFGVAATLFENGQRKNARYTVIGTPCYMAPEILQEGTGYTQKADIWSFGITAIELATGQAPYSNLQPLAVVQKILRAPPPILTSKSGEHSPELCQVIKACLNHDPTKRPTADELLQMPFFAMAQPPEYLKTVLISKIPTLEKRYATIRAKGTQCAINHDKQSSTPNQGFQFDFLDDANSNNSIPQQQQLLQISVEPNNGKESHLDISSSEDSNTLNNNFPLNNFGLNVIDFTTDSTSISNKSSSNDNNINSNVNNNTCNCSSTNISTSPNSDSTSILNDNSKCNINTNKNINVQIDSVEKPKPSPNDKSPNVNEERIKKGRFNLTKKPSHYFSYQGEANLRLQPNSSSNSNSNSNSNVSTDSIMHSSEVLIPPLEVESKSRLKSTSHNNNNNNYLSNLQSSSLPPNANPLNMTNKLSNNDNNSRLMNNYANRNTPNTPKFQIDKGNNVNSSIKTTTNQNEAAQNNVKSNQKLAEEDKSNENLFEIMQKLNVKTEKLTEETHALKSEIKDLLDIIQSLSTPKET